jgi:hypothetical protein
MEELVLRITEQGADETAGSIRNINVSFNQLNQNIQRLEKSTAGMTIQNIGRGITNLGMNMKRVLTDNIINLGKAILNVSIDFEYAMSEVRAISGATAEEFVLLREKAKEMGIATKYSATESATALKFMAQAGWKTEDMLVGIEGIMNLAAASGEDLATTTNIVVDSIAAFGLTSIICID